MDRTTTLSQIRPMSIDDRVWLIRGIQDSINEDAELTDSEKQELDCRIADMEAHPDEGSVGRMFTTNRLSRCDIEFIDHNSSRRNESMTKRLIGTISDGQALAEFIRR